MPSWSNGLDGVTVAVKVGFASTPATAIGSTTFVDVVADVREVTIDYGKANERDDYQAGKATVVLDSRSRQYDNLYSAGAHFGQILPGKRIRIEVTYSAVTVGLFTGYVNGWPQTYTLDGDTVCTVQATDGFSVLQRAYLGSVYEQEVRADTPYLWWRFGESAGTTVADSSGNSRDGTYNGGATFASRAGLVVDGQDNSIEFTGTMEAVTRVPWPAAPFSVELWFNVPTPPLPGQFHHLVSAGGSTSAKFLITLWDQGLIVTFGDSNVWQVTASVITSTLTPYYNGLHHVVVTQPSGAFTPNVYVDGVLATASAGSGGTPAAIGQVDLAVRDARLAAALDPYTADLDEFAIYPSVLSGARVAAHYSAGTAPWAGLDTGTVCGKVLDAAGWPAADRNIETGKTLVAGIPIAGRTALEVLKDLEKSEQGRFFMEQGKATFYSRHHAFTTSTSTTSQTTFGDAAGERQYVDLQPDYSDTFIRNNVQTQGVAGSIYTTKDLTSIGQYGEFRDEVKGLLNQSEAEIRDIGPWRIAHYKDPAYRFESMTVNPRADATNLFPVVRDRKLCDRVTVKRRPGPIGAPVGTLISQDVLIEGINHRISRDMTWTTTYRLSPAEIGVYAVLDDATYGVLDTARLAL